MQEFGLRLGIPIYQQFEEGMDRKKEYCSGKENCSGIPV